MTFRAYLVLDEKNQKLGLYFFVSHWRVRLALKFSRQLQRTEANQWLIRGLTFLSSKQFLRRKYYQELSGLLTDPSL